MGGEGGLIAVDAAGRVALEFNTERMYRGVVTSDAAPTTRIFRDS
jgi:beta-aspartyl-peptidase (threonine type)